LILIRKKRVLVQTVVFALLAFLVAPLILSPTYLSSSEVKASPTIGSTTATLYSTEDAYVNASSPDTNYGSETTLCVAANSEKDFTYVKFDLTSIPSGAYIISAKLELYLSDTTGSFYYYLFGGNDDAIGAYHCSDNSWTEPEITWNNSPASALSPEPTSSWSFGMSYTKGNYKSWDVTSDAKTAFSSGTLTEALKFQFKSESGDGQAFFHSKEGSNKPKLEVEYSMQPVAVVNLESAQDPEATNNLGFITFAGNPFSLPTDINVVPGSYQITYRSGYTFTKWETSGGVTVSNVNSATTTATVSSSGTLRAIGNVTQLEYTYDHENAGSESKSAGYIDAVRFTPLISGQLITARFYIQYISSSLSNTFKVHVMDENRHDIINPFTRTPTSTGWSDVDLSSYNINVNTGVDFYIGMEWITDYNPNFGGSYYSSTDRSWTWNGTNWQDALSEFMIRAVTWTANPATCSLTITTTAGGSTNPIPGTHIYNAGTAVSVQASANADYLFDHWELDGTDKGNSNPYTVTMNTDQTLQALFTPRATPTPTSAPTAEQTPTPSSNPAPSPSPSPSVSPSPSPPSSEPPGPTSTPQEGYFLSKETLYAISAVTVIIVVSIAAFALRKRRK
jgi:hypothetical protein